jgi:hypothetical protein
VRRVLHQHVLETIDRIRWCAALEDQLGCDESAESSLELVLRKPGDGAQQRVGKLASYRRADLRHQPHRRQAVQPRHQRVLQRRRDRKRLQRAVEHVTMALFT